MSMTKVVAIAGFIARHKKRLALTTDNIRIVVKDSRQENLIKMALRVSPCRIGCDFQIVKNNNVASV